MPSPTYQSLIQLVSPYMGEQKAKEVLDRYLGGAKPEAFSKSDLQKNLNPITIATKLYVSDKNKREELAEKLKRLAA